MARNSRNVGVQLIVTIVHDENKTTYSLLYRFLAHAFGVANKTASYDFKITLATDNKNCCFVLFVFSKTAFVIVCLQFANHNQLLSESLRQ